MKRPPLIGVTVGRDLERPEYLRIRQAYTDAVAAAGGTPVLVPPLPEAALADLLVRLDGLLVSGGVDVDPGTYGERSHAKTTVDPERDALEFGAVGWALETRRPVLGICRGMQLLNVVMGGSLVQDLPSEGRAHWQPGQWSDVFHRIAVAPGSKLAAIIGAPSTDVNSFHHQAIRALGRGLRAVAWAEDGVIEAIEGTARPWLLGLQWHPENLQGRDHLGRSVFTAFVQACAQEFAGIERAG